VLIIFWKQNHNLIFFIVKISLHNNLKEKMKNTPETLSILRPCMSMWGACEIVYADPNISDVQNIVALPYVPGGAWGIFDRSGNPINTAFDRHGPEGKPADRQLVATSNLIANNSLAKNQTYIYGGFVHLHYGHFIVNTLPRLWPILRHGIGEHRILFIGQATPADWFRIPFMRDFFGALGINSDRIEFVDSPTVIPRLIIPHPSFQEQHFAHRVFGQLCREIGRRIIKVNDIESRMNLKPIYLSKNKLTSGVARFSNESILIEKLYKSGFEIVYPELLEPSEQISMMRTRKFIFGTIGSAFHNSVFSRTSAELVCISRDSHPNSNFMLLDRLSGSSVRYFYAPGTNVDPTADSNFNADQKLPCPELIAEDLLKIFREIQ